MGDFSKVVVHFESGNKEWQVEVLPKKGVQAIFLNGAERGLVVTRRKSGRRIGRRETDRPPKGTKLVPPPDMPEDIMPGEGPRGVCYLVERGDIECWSEPLSEEDPR